MFGEEVSRLFPRVRCYDTKDLVSNVEGLALSWHMARTKGDYATAKAGAKSALVNGDFTLFVLRDFRCSPRFTGSHAIQHNEMSNLVTPSESTLLRTLGVND